MKLEGKKVLVVGLGKSGLAAVRFLAKQGARVCANDGEPEESFAGMKPELERLGIELQCGHHQAALIDGVDVVVVSPGVPLELEIFRRARERDIPILGELELALHCVTKPVVAVTGTNGKSTTTTLIGHLLNTAGFRTCMAGNIGTPLLEVIDEANASDWVVLEISSFQIETAPSLRPHIAVLLNISPDHLDRYSSFEAYAAVKARLFAMLPPDGWGIYNARDEVVVRHIKGMRTQLVPFDVRKESKWNLEGVPLKGEHNRENILAAFLAAERCGVKSNTLMKGLRTFQGLKHRLEFVREHGGISFVDDSKGTNVDATVRALRSFQQPIVLIAGGVEKGGSYTPLISELQKRVKQLILIGKAADAMERSFGRYVQTVRASSMEEAVAKAVAAASSGDVVLLSPACASFDMFENYAARGAAFVAAVRKWEEKSVGGVSKTAL